MANSADPDQTAPFRSSLIRVYNVCSETFVPTCPNFSDFVIGIICISIQAQKNKGIVLKCCQEHVVFKTEYG